LKHYFPGLCG